MSNKNLSTVATQVIGAYGITATDTSNAARRVARKNEKVAEAA